MDKSSILKSTKYFGRGLVQNSFSQNVVIYNISIARTTADATLFHSCSIGRKMLSSIAAESVLVFVQLFTKVSLEVSRMSIYLERSNFCFQLFIFISPSKKRCVF